MRVNNQAIIVINMDVFEEISGRKIKDKYYCQQITCNLSFIVLHFAKKIIR